jgi:hypothetical protein
MILLTDDLGNLGVLGSVRALVKAAARASSVAISDRDAPDAASSRATLELSSFSAITTSNRSAAIPLRPVGELPLLYCCKTAASLTRQPNWTSVPRSIPISPKAKEYFTLCCITGKPERRTMKPFRLLARAHERFRKELYSEQAFWERRNSAVVGFPSPRFRRVFGTGCCG